MEEQIFIQEDWMKFCGWDKVDEEECRDWNFTAGVEIGCCQLCQSYIWRVGLTVICDKCLKELWMQNSRIYSL